MSMPRTADKSALESLVSSLSTPVFLAGLDESSRPCLTLHSARSGAGRNLRREAKQALALSGIGVRCKVREHGAKRLAKDASLEQLIGRFRHDTIVFDPTGGVARSEAVVRCAANIRGALGAGVAGIYLEPWRRTLYVVLHRDFVVQDGTVAPDRLREIETSLAAGVGKGLDGGSFKLAVRVGFALPNVSVVPVDAASARAGRARPRVLRMLRSGSIAATVAAFFGIGIAATAIADGPAVDGTNVKISGAGGKTDGGATGLGSASVSFPLGETFGAQLDGRAGKIDGDTMWGAGGSLFWRDPDKGLIGLTGSYDHRDDHDPDSMTRVGAEVELYLDRFTAIGRGGYQSGDVEDGPYGRIDLRWYATDDFMLSAGGEVAVDEYVGRFRVEFRPAVNALPGLSLFAEGEVGEDNWTRVIAGVRFYFGNDKSLIRRHREDWNDTDGHDPEFAMRKKDKDGYGGTPRA